VREAAIRADLEKTTKTYAQIASDQNVGVSTVEKIRSRWDVQRPKREPKTSPVNIINTLKMLIADGITDPETLAAKLGVTPNRVVRELASLGKPTSLPRPAESQFDDHDMLTALREAHTFMRHQYPHATTLQIGAYAFFRELRTQLQLPGWPAPQTIETRFGGWPQACIEAGIRNPTTKQRTPRQKREFTDPIPAFLAQCKTERVPATSARYDTWAPSNSAPGRQTLLRHLNKTWAQTITSYQRKPKDKP
jgi:hypothetical protein